MSLRKTAIKRAIFGARLTVAVKPNLFCAVEERHLRGRERARKAISNR